MTRLTDFRLTASDFTPFGSGLSRPECAFRGDDGIWVSDSAGGGLALVREDGIRRLGSGIHEPNGFSRRKNGTFVVAGLEDHTVYEIAPDGTTTVLLKEIEGRPLGVVNHCWVDDHDRVYLGVMTDRAHWYDAINAGSEGYIVLLDQAGARIVADGLHLCNEVKVSADGRYLYAAETLARRIVRFPVRADGSLGLRQTVGPDNLGFGATPDGFTLDAEGNVWVTTILRNGIVVITKDGDAHTVFEEVNEGALQELAEAIAASTATVALMGPCFGPTLKLPTSLAFGGDDRRTVYVGSLASTELMTFRSPVAG